MLIHAESTSNSVGAAVGAAVAAIVLLVIIVLIIIVALRHNNDSRVEPVPNAAAVKRETFSKDDNEFIQVDNVAYGRASSSSSKGEFSAFMADNPAYEGLPPHERNPLYAGGRTADNVLLRNDVYGATSIQSDGSYARLGASSGDSVAAYSTLQHAETSYDAPYSSAPPSTLTMSAELQSDTRAPAWFRNARPSVVHTARLAAFLTVRLSRTEAEALLTPAMPSGMYLLRRSTKKRDALVLTLKTGPGAVKHMEVCESSRGVSR